MSTSPLRVAMVSETYPPEVNGVALTVQALEQGLRALGHPVELIRPRRRDEPPRRALHVGRELRQRGRDLVDLGDVECRGSAFFPDRLGGGFWDDAELSQRIGGMRLEDIIVIEENGPARLLTPGLSPSLEKPCG